MKMLKWAAPLLMPLLLLACAGAPPVPRDPEPVQRAFREMQKGNQWYQKGCHGRALDRYFSAHERFTSMDWVPGIAMSMNNIGNVYRATGDWESAIGFYREASELYDTIDQAPGWLQSTTNLAAALTDAMALDAAAHVLDRADAFADAHRLSPAAVWINRGILLTRQKRYDAAAHILMEARRRLPDAEDDLQANAAYALGRLMVETGRHENALALFETALTHDRRRAYFKGIADDLWALGNVHQVLGHTEAAIGHVKRAIKLYALMGDRPTAAALMGQLESWVGDDPERLRITRHFMETWTTDPSTVSPCER